MGNVKKGGEGVPVSVGHCLFGIGSRMKVVMLLPCGIGLPWLRHSALFCSRLLADTLMSNWHDDMNLNPCILIGP